MDATTVAVDLAKTVFELAIANAQWRVVSRQRLNRAQFARYLTQTSPTHIVMEACGMAHYWGRLAQQHGHRVTLVPPAYVRPYVRRNKTDRADAEAILEAVRSGEMPSVPVKRVRTTSAGRAAPRARAVDDDADGADQYPARDPARARPLAAGRRPRGAAGRARRSWTMPRRALPMHLRAVLASVHEEIRAIEERIAQLETRAPHPGRRLTRS